MSKCKIDRLLTRLLNDGSIDVKEAVAIRCSVTYTKFHLSDKQHEDFRVRYGTVTLEGIEQLMKYE